MMSVSRGVRTTGNRCKPSDRESVRSGFILAVHTAHRVFYVAMRADAIYVLHAFEKKTRSIPCTGEIEAAA